MADFLGISYKGQDNAGAGFYTASSSTARETQQYFYHSDHLGSSTFITDADGNVAQHIEYMPFGEVFLEERNNAWSTPYKFNGKELDEETGLYYYGARYYDPRTSVWIGVDPLTEKYPNVGSYVYCLDNPVKYVDPDGRQCNNSLLLTILSDKNYKFNLAAAHLLHLVSGVNEKQILTATVRFEESSPSSGSSLTAGNNPDNSIITHYYKNGVNYNETNGASFDEFTVRNAHEVGHIPQVSGVSHLIGSLMEYVQNIVHGENWHDGKYSTKEKEADKGAQVFMDFRNFVDKNYQKNSIEKLFKNKNNNQDVIIKRIDQWWKAYIKQKNENQK